MYILSSQLFTKCSYQEVKIPFLHYISYYLSGMFLRNPKRYNIRNIYRNIPYVYCSAILPLLLCCILLTPTIILLEMTPCHCTMVDSSLDSIYLQLAGRPNLDQYKHYNNGININRLFFSSFFWFYF